MKNNAPPNSAVLPNSKIVLLCAGLVLGALLLSLSLKLGPALLTTLALVAVTLKLQAWLLRSRINQKTVPILCASFTLLLLLAVVGMGSSVVQFIALKAQQMLPDFLEQLRLAARQSSFEMLHSYGEMDNAEVVDAVTEWAGNQAAFWMAMTGSGLKVVTQVFFAGLISVSLVVRITSSETHNSGLSYGLRSEGNRFLDCFSHLLTAQLYVALWNTSVTLLYVFILLPLLNVELPLREALVVATFLLSFIPALGNVMANCLMMVLCLQYPPWVLGLSLVYLVSVHKMEYLINARILSSAYQASVAELLACIVFGESLFGLPGLILMPVTYLYIKDVLKRERIW
jgi:predicted PurR-regulated permease PerM